jgi:hypothetical protein
MTADVRWPKSDMPRRSRDVRFQGKFGHPNSTGVSDL